MIHKIREGEEKLLTPSKKVVEKPFGSIILFGYINEPPGGGGGGGWDPDYPTYPGTGGGGGGGESTSDGMGGTLPSGNISTDGQEQRSATFWAPPITNFVRFTYRSLAALLPGVTVQTKSLGSWKSASGTANPVTYKTLDVGLYASNVQVTVTYQTTDSNGGACQWQAMHY